MIVVVMESYYLLVMFVLVVGVVVDVEGFDEDFFFVDVEEG